MMGIFSQKKLLNMNSMPEVFKLEQRLRTKGNISAPMTFMREALLRTGWKLEHTKKVLAAYPLISNEEQVCRINYAMGNTYLRNLLNRADEQIDYRLASDYRNQSSTLQTNPEYADWVERTMGSGYFAKVERRIRGINNEGGLPIPPKVNILDKMWGVFYIVKHSAKHGTGSILPKAAAIVAGVFGAVTSISFAKSMYDKSQFQADYLSNWVDLAKNCYNFAASVIGKIIHSLF